MYEEIVYSKKQRRRMKASGQHFTEITMTDTSMEGISLTDLLAGRGEVSWADMSEITEDRFGVQQFIQDGNVHTSWGRESATRVSPETSKVGHMDSSVDFRLAPTRSGLALNSTPTVRTTGSSLTLPQKALPTVVNRGSDSSAVRRPKRGPEGSEKRSVSFLNSKSGSGRGVGLKPSENPCNSNRTVEPGSSAQRSRKSRKRSKGSSKITRNRNPSNA
jgi:hypothetical protein